MFRDHRHSLLPHFLAVLYGLSIAYASLQPFAPWVAPLPGTPFFLFAPWPSRWIRADVALNVIAYVPLGLFTTLIPRRASPAGKLAIACAIGGGLSFALETLQMYLPPRDASTIDLLSNTAGTLVGALGGIALLRSAVLRRALSRLRERWFLRGGTGDLGLALVLIWLAVQVNPGIPLFSAVYDASPQLGAAVTQSAAPPDLAAVLIEGAHSAFQVLGVGLFIAVLIREPRYVGFAVAALVGAGLVVKGLGAAALLKPAAWEHWLSPGVSIGIAFGALALPIVIVLPRPAQIAICAIALLSSVMSTLFAPELLLAKAPLSLFNWSYGQLLNFNGLTRTVLMFWPLAASAYLLLLAGKPGWGNPR
jgi:VanZ family protein